MIAVFTTPAKLRRKRRPPISTLQLQILEPGQPLAVMPQLVMDINPLTASSSPGWLENMSGAVYFSATVDGDRELWKSDGTAAGTSRMKDIALGASSNPRSMTNVAGTLFFVAYEPATGFELWKSDGTESGTILVKDIRPGPRPQDTRDRPGHSGVAHQRERHALFHSKRRNQWP